MIVVHGLANVKERGQSSLLRPGMHMEPDYHQLRLDVCLSLTGVETVVLRAGATRAR